MSLFSRAHLLPSLLRAYEGVLRDERPGEEIFSPFPEIQAPDAFDKEDVLMNLLECICVALNEFYDAEKAALAAKDVHERLEPEFWFCLAYLTRENPVLKRSSERRMRVYTVLLSRLYKMNKKLASCIHKECPNPLFAGRTLIAGLTEQVRRRVCVEESVNVMIFVQEQKNP